jgi:hypothetical protein
MVLSGDAATRTLGQAMMEALDESRRTGKPLIKGIVIEAGEPPCYDPHDITEPRHGKDGYDFTGFGPKQP